MDNGPHSKCDNFSRAIDYANRYVHPNGNYNDVDANADDANADANADTNADTNANADPMIMWGCGIE